MIDIIDINLLQLNLLDFLCCVGTTKMLTILIRENDYKILCFKEPLIDCASNKHQHTKK